MPATNAVPRLLRRVERWLKSHRQRYWAGLQPGVSESSIKAAESAMGLGLPAELRALLRWRNGQSASTIGGFQESWRTLPLEQIVEVTLAQRKDGGWKHAWIALMDDDGGNYRLLDTSTSPAGVLESHGAGAAPLPVADSLEIWLTSFTRDLEANRYIEDTERGSYMRINDDPPRA